MNQFTSIKDVKDLKKLINKALQLKNNPLSFSNLGEEKTIGLLFFNPSLRTRMSTQKAAQNLGMSVITLNAGEGWKLEFEDNVIMNADKAEHIREAAQVISQYCDVIGIRTFPGLKDQALDYQDLVLNKFIEFATVPVVSLESAIRHPLQSFADVLTISEHKKTERPKVVLTWAPHPKPLPQAVPNSFAEWMLAWGEVDLTITHPEGYELCESFTAGATIEHDQKEAFKGADFIYAKNWSSYSNYGQILSPKDDWKITAKKMALTNNGKFMHCLPVRRNVVVADEVLDNANSLVIEQAKNRIFAAQAVLNEIIR